MDSNFRPLIALPTYNNRPTLRAVVRACLRHRLPVLVVDDGSTDGAIDTIGDLPVNRLRHKTNRGKGVAIRTAARWAARHDFTHILTIDADGQHDPDDIPRLVETARANPLAVILGRRDFNSADVPGSSRFGRWWSNLWVYLTSGVHVGDSQSGFRVYPVETLRQLEIHARRYSFEVEILVRGIWAGLVVVDVPVSVRYQPDGERVSHFRPFLDNLRTTGTYTRLFFRHFTPLPHEKRFGPDARRLHLSWRHPWRSFLSVHRHIFRKHEKTELRQLSLRHPVRSLKRLHIESTSPREVGLAAAAGVFLGTLPFVATHTVVIVFVTTRLKLNRAIAFYASNLCAPFWPPFIPAINIEVGHFLLRGRWITADDLDSGAKLWQTLGQEVHLRFLEYALGSLIVAPVLALIVGPIAYGLARWLRSAKNRLRKEPAHE